MVKLIATRGYAGSGKSTWASKWLFDDPDNRVIVSRDDLRSDLFQADGVLSHDKEGLVTKIQRQIVEVAVKAGKDVVIHDTNLRAKFLKDWADYAADLGADFEVKDFLVPVDECLARASSRTAAGGRSVPSEVIRNQAKRFPMPWPTIASRGNLTLAVTPYEDQPGLPTVVICDIDGTVADMTKNGRNPFDLTRVSEDDPITKVIDVVNALGQVHKVIFLSGREDVCYQDSKDWLEKHVRPDVELYMRKAGDHRTDFIIKNELFDAHIRGKYNVVAVFDDRLQVARLWHQLGLPLFRVGDPEAKF